MKLHSRRLGVAATAVVIMVTPQSSVSMQQQNEAPYRNRTLPIEKRVEDLLGRMTLDEKIGQMTQADHASLKDATEVDTLFLGSVLSGGDSELPDVSAKAWRTHTETLQKRALGTRLGIPLIYGIDAVHGHSNVRGAVVFPHNIGMGCTRNPKLVEEAVSDHGARGRGHRHALELRALHRRAAGRSLGPHLRGLRRDSGAGRDAWRPPPCAGSRAPTCRVQAACWRPRSTSSATAAHATVSIAAIRSSTKRRSDDFTCPATSPRSRLASARSWCRTTAGTARRCTAIAASSPTC